MVWYVLVWFLLSVDIRPLVAAGMVATAACSYRSESCRHQTLVTRELSSCRFAENNNKGMILDILLAGLGLILDNLGERQIYALYPRKRVA